MTDVPGADAYVRLAGPADGGLIAELRARWSGADGDAEVERHVREWLAAEGDRRLVWLAWLGDEPVGMATVLEYHRMPRAGRLASRWGYVGNMFVREDVRNRGVGAALLGAIVDTADGRGYARLTLSPTERAVPLYRRAGFVDADASLGGDRMLVRRSAKGASTGRPSLTT